MFSLTTFATACGDAVAREQRHWQLVSVERVVAATNFAVRSRVVELAVWRLLPEPDRPLMNASEIRM